MPVYKAEAIVIRRRPLGEADRVLTLFTREHGKLAAVAKGVRKTTSKLSGRLEPFAQVRLLLARGRGTLDVLAQVEVVEGMAALRSDLRRYGQSALVAEMLEAATPEREAHPELFDLFAAALHLLRDVPDAPVALWFALHLMALVGFRPALAQCAVGGEAPGASPAWSHPLGGVVCGRHAGRDPAAVRLRPEMVRALSALMGAGAADVPAVEVARRDRAPLLELLRRYAEHRLEVHLRSPAVIEKLRSRGD